MASRVHPRLREPVLLLSHLNDSESLRGTSSLSTGATDRTDCTNYQPSALSNAVRQRQLEAIEENSRSLSDGDDDDNQPKLFSVGTGALPPPVASLASRLASAGRASREVSPRSVSPSATTSMVAVPLIQRHSSHSRRSNHHHHSTTSGSQSYPNSLPAARNANSGAASAEAPHNHHSSHRGASPSVVMSSTQRQQAWRDDYTHLLQQRYLQPSPSNRIIPTFVELEDIADDPNDQWEEQIDVDVGAPSAEACSAGGLLDNAQDLDDKVSPTNNQQLVAWIPPPEIGHIKRYFEPALTPPRRRQQGLKTFPSPLTEIRGARYHDSLPHESPERHVGGGASVATPVLGRSAGGSARRTGAPSSASRCIPDDIDPIPLARPILSQRPEPRAMQLDVTIEQFLEKTSKLLNNNTADGPAAETHSPKIKPAVRLEGKLCSDATPAVAPVSRTSAVPEASLHLDNNKSSNSLIPSPDSLLVKHRSSVVQPSAPPAGIEADECADGHGPLDGIPPNVAHEVPQGESAVVAESSSTSLSETIQPSTSGTKPSTAEAPPQLPSSPPPPSLPTAASHQNTDALGREETPEEIVLDAPVVQSREASSAEDTKAEVKAEPIVSHRGESSRSHQNRPSLRERAAAKRQTRKTRPTTSPSRVVAPLPQRSAIEERSTVPQQPPPRSSSARRILEVPPRSLRKDPSAVQQQRSGSVVLLPPPSPSAERQEIKRSSSNSGIVLRPEVPQRRPSLSGVVSVDRSAPPAFISKRAAACPQGTNTDVALGAATFQSSGSIRISAPAPPPPPPPPAPPVAAGSIRKTAPPPPAVSAAGNSGSFVPAQMAHSASAASAVPSREAPRRLPIARRRTSR